MYDIVSYTGEIPNFDVISYTNVNKFNENDNYLFESDVINENNLDDSSIEDILELLPTKIQTIYSLNMMWDNLFERWVVGYSFEINNNYIYSEFDKDLHKALIKLYNKIKDIINETE